MVLSRPLAVVTAVVVLAAAIGATAAGFTLAPFGLAKVVAVGAGLGLVAWFYTRVRPVPAFAAALSGTALLLVFTAAGATLSYAVAAMGFPLRDAEFAALDAALGVDWNGFLAFVAERPWLAATLVAAYHSSLLQTILVVVTLGLTGRTVALERFLVAYATTAVVVVLVSGFLPALGAYAHHDPDPAIRLMTAEAGVWHLAHFEALRAGTFLELDLVKAEGIVTFPSFHTVLAILTVWALWEVRVLRWPALVLNVFVVVGTVPEGGHYVVDLIAGGAIATVAILVLSRRPRAATASAPSPAAAPAVTA